MQAKLDALVHAVKMADARFITRFAPQMIRIWKQRDASSVSLKTCSLAFTVPHNRLGWWLACNRETGPTFMTTLGFW